MKQKNKILIKNGNAILEDRVIKSDILIENGKISAIEDIDYEIENCVQIDAYGCYIMPGIIDMHTHLDDYIGDYNLADTYASASSIALKNGITTLFNFITQKDKPLKEEVKAAKDKLHQYSADNLCHFRFHLTPTNFSDESCKEIISLIENGYKTFKFYTTYKKAGIYFSYKKIEEIINKFRKYDLTYLIHCEDEDILSSLDTTDFDFGNAFTHTLLRPAYTEVRAIGNILEIAERTKAKIHIVHTTTAEGAELIYKYKQKYDNVSNETCPQYLFLNEHYLKSETGHHYLCTPPLRSKENSEKMRQYVKDNYFDVIATDHCAFLKKDKDRFKNDIRNVPSGFPGIGALPGLVFNLYQNLTYVGQSSGLSKDLIQISHLLSANPAKICGLYPSKGVIRKNADADLVIFRLNDNLKNIQSSESDCYEPYEGFKTEYDVITTIFNGNIQSD
jgi:dihydropyrimidinase